MKIQVGLDKTIKLLGSEDDLVLLVLGGEQGTGYTVHQLGISGKQSCNTPTCLCLAILYLQFSICIDYTYWQQIFPDSSLLLEDLRKYFVMLRDIPEFLSFLGHQGMTTLLNLFTLLLLSNMWQDYPLACVTPFGIQEEDLGWAHLVSPAQK